MAEEDATQLDTQMYQDLPAALQELAADQENLARISEWCADTYVAPGEDRQQVYHKTQIYLKDALHTVTQHVCKVADGLAQRVELQSVELEGVDAMVRLVENRLAYQKEQIGRSAVSLQVSRREFAPKKGASAERGSPSTAAVQLRAEDGRINFEAFERVGELGTGPSVALEPSLQSFAPPAPADAGQQQRPPPPPVASMPPPPVAGMPPPPVAGMPPPPVASMPPPPVAGMPPPPPPIGAGMPPPPPPLGADMPPPPPPGTGTML